MILWFVVAALALSVLWDWWKWNGVNHRIRPEHVTQKPTTAIMFVLMVAGSLTRRVVIRDVFGGLIIVFAVISLSNPIQIGVDDAVKSVGPGVPSTGTVFAFVLCGLSVFFKNVQFIRAIVFMLGLIALIGYAVQVPLLYYHWDGSTAMAISTAIGFICTAMAMESSNETREHAAGR